VTATAFDDHAVRRARRPARILARAVVWDLRLQLRYQIVTVSVVVTLLYGVLFRVLPPARSDGVTALLIFADPTTIGFLFVGVLVLFERGAETLYAVVVTPLSPGQYLWSKAISLTCIALPCGVFVAFAAKGTGINLLPLVLGVALTSLVLVFVGFVAVARVRSVNEYLLIVPGYLVPATLPLLALAGIDSPLFYLFPTYGTILLLEATFDPVPIWQLVYAVAVLTAAVVGAYIWALRVFDRHVRQPGRSR
jgi:fluoroquinolone transport system permease protein